MKKQVFALILLSILVLTLITGCTEKVVDDTATNDENAAEEEVATGLETDLIDDDDTVELGELI